jgi:predicted Fe-Mo cluster-binding NifX family protein
MKIAVSSTGAELQSAVDPRFGRCKFFIVYDEETKESSSIENASQFASGGAGIQAAQTVSEAGARVVLTGNIGPNAYQTLSAAEITVITGVSGRVEGAIEGYLKGEYRATDAPTVRPHFGQRE